jgi:hypothetical protein
VVAGLSAIFSIFFLPWLVIALWLAVASILLFIAGNPRPRAA